MFNSSNNIINKIKSWFDNNWIELNLDKSKYDYFNLYSEKIDLMYKILVTTSTINITNKIILQSVNNLKFLGV